jgi:hypothetical protein
MSIVQKLRDFYAGAKVSEHGIFEIPGRHELELPAGTVKLYYREEWFTDDVGVRVPKELEVSLNPAGGGPAVPLSMGLPRSGSKFADQGAVAYTFKKLGQAEVAAGSYILTAEPAVRPDSMPRIMVGS